MRLLMNRRPTIFLAHAITLLYSLLFSSMAHGYDQLRIMHPQQTWRFGQGTIEEAIISIRPQGIYMEYGLYLTFSARDLSFTAADSVEVQFNFDLSQSANSPGRQIQRRFSVCCASLRSLSTTGLFKNHYRYQ